MNNLKKIHEAADQPPIKVTQHILRQAESVITTEVREWAHRIEITTDTSKAQGVNAELVRQFVEWLEGVGEGFARDRRPIAFTFQSQKGEFTIFPTDFLTGLIP